VLYLVVYGLVAVFRKRSPGRAEGSAHLVQRRSGRRELDLVLPAPFCRLGVTRFRRFFVVISSLLQFFDIP
jgi:hypothetical protein